jgi:PAS domain S-box-containing protein
MPPDQPRSTTIDNTSGIPDPFLFVDRAGVIRLWNPGAERLFGYSAKAAVGRTLDLIVPEPVRTAHWEGFSRAVRHGRFTKDKVSLTILSKDGRSIELIAAFIRSAAGEVQGIAAIGRDVTEQLAHGKAQQERIASLERQVERLTEALALPGEGDQPPNGAGTARLSSLGEALDASGREATTD